MQCPDIFAISTLGHAFLQLIVGTTEQQTGKEVILVPIGCKSTWFAYQRPNEMPIVDGMLLLADQAGQGDRELRPHLRLQRFSMHANCQRGANEP